MIHQPVQRPRIQSPYVGLAAAIIEQAFDDACCERDIRSCGMSAYTRRKTAEEAQRWIEEGGYRYLSDLIGVEPSQIERAFEARLAAVGSGKVYPKSRRCNAV